jgi:hypothetical protein
MNGVGLFSIPDEVIRYSNLPSHSRSNMILALTRPLSEISTRNLPGSKERPARKADNFTAICEPIIWKMCDPQSPIIIQVSTACYKD